MFNIAFDHDIVDYTCDYENSLYFSPALRDYAGSLASRLIERYGIYGKKVIEIGCGSGEFLSELCLNGKNRGIGFDPAARSEDTSRITFVKDYYTENYSQCKACHMLQACP